MLQKRPCGGRQEQAFGTAIIGIGPAFDQAGLAQPVEQAGQTNRLEVEHLGKFGLLEALEAVEPCEHRPLRPGDPILSPFVVRIGFQHSSDIIDYKGKFSIQGAR